MRKEALAAYFDRIRWIQVAVGALGCALAAVEGFVLSWRLGAITFTFVIGAACNLGLEAVRGAAVALQQPNS